MLNVKPHGFLNRFVACIAGLTIIGLGSAPIAKGEFDYSNWFGGLVFAPLAVLFGLFTMFCAIFRPEWLQPKAAATRHHRQ